MASQVKFLCLQNISGLLHGKTALQPWHTVGLLLKLNKTTEKNKHKWHTTIVIQVSGSPVIHN